MTAVVRGIGEESACDIDEASPRELFVITGTPLPLRRLTSISVDLAGEDSPLSLTGRVIERRLPEAVSQSDVPPGMRLRLTATDRDDVRRWREFVESRADPESQSDAPEMVVWLGTTDTLESLLELESESVELVVRGISRYEPGRDVVCNVVHPEGHAVFELRGRVLDTRDEPLRQRGTEVALPPVDDARLEQLETFVLGDSHSET